MRSDEVAQRISKTPQRVRQLCKAGQLPGALKWGRDWVVPVDAVLLWEQTAKKRNRKRKAEA